jgi:hypothetical protein
MNTPYASRGPAAAGYRHFTWFDLQSDNFAQSLDQFGEARRSPRSLFREAMRWLGAGVMRAFNSPRVRQAGSWPRYTRDGLL